jgi:hypothetical protein
LSKKTGLLKNTLQNLSIITYHFYNYYVSIMIQFESIANEYQFIKALSAKKTDAVKIFCYPIIEKNSRPSLNGCLKKFAKQKKRQHQVAAFNSKSTTTAYCKSLLLISV